MEYANKQRENTSQSKKENVTSSGKVPFSDNRTTFVTQTRFIDLIQRVPDSKINHVVQRDPIGTGRARGGFNSANRDRFGRPIRADRLTIDTTRPMPATLYVHEDERGRTVTDDGGKLLKHYMVVKNGTSYQLPVKHLYEPGYAAGANPWIPNDAENHIHCSPDARGRAPKAAKTYGERSHQPEGFGGNQDWDNRLVERGTVRDGAFTVASRNSEGRTVNRINVAASREATLLHEYQEEARRAPINIIAVNSKYFDAGWAVGTMSIVSTTQDLDYGTPEQRRTPTILPSFGYTPSPPGNVRERGMAEMAGTITIDCGDLVAEINVAGGQPEIERLEIEIGRRIQDQRNALLRASGVSQITINGMLSPFAQQAGILSHLVTMIAEDLIADKIS